MVDDRPENQGSLPESERPKREPPTIDLEATRSDQRDRESKRCRRSPEAATSEAAASEAAMRAGCGGAGAATGACAGAGFALDRCARLRRGGGRARDRRRLDAGLARRSAGGSASGAAAQRRAIDDLTARIAGLETKTSKPAAPVADPAAAARGWRRWKNRSPRCAANSQPRARRTKNLRPPSTR